MKYKLSYQNRSEVVGAAVRQGTVNCKNAVSFFCMSQKSYQGIFSIWQLSPLAERGLP